MFKEKEDFIWKRSKILLLQNEIHIILEEINLKFPFVFQLEVDVH